DRDFSPGGIPATLAMIISRFLNIYHTSGFLLPINYILLQYHHANSCLSRGAAALFSKAVFELF
ncbi:MAG: hypothetical protein ACNA7Z_09615, partial [Dethiobacteria bacterium]